MPINLSLQNPYQFMLPTSTEEIERWAELAFKESQKVIELCLRMVDEAESATLNNQYRKKKGPTNVLSFPTLLPPDIAESVLLGDLVICIPLVEKEAQDAGISPRNHLAHLVIHGCLHLQGYDHIETEEALEMEGLETQLLSQLGFADPYADNGENHGE